MTATLPASPELTDEWLQLPRVANVALRLRITDHVVEVQRLDNHEGIWSDLTKITRHRSSPSAEWKPIDTALKDGTEFQAWVGHWQPVCRFNPDTEVFEIWGRVDYDQYDFDVYTDLIPTHWQPKPEAPK